jgi:hypothetical protein
LDASGGCADGENVASSLKRQLSHRGAAIVDGGFADLLALLLGSAQANACSPPILIDEFDTGTLNRFSEFLPGVLPSAEFASLGFEPSDSRFGDSGTLRQLGLRPPEQRACSLDLTCSHQGECLKLIEFLLTGRINDR